MHYSQHKTRFLLPPFADGDILLLLVESVSDLGLHLSEELLTVLVEPALLATKQYKARNDTLKQRKTLKRNPRTFPRHTHMLFSGFSKYGYWSNQEPIKQDHQWNPTPKGEKPWTVYLHWWARKEWIFRGCVAGVKSGKGLEGSGEGGVGRLIRWDQ